MTRTLEYEPLPLAETETPEYQNSAEVYADIIPAAWQLSLLNPQESRRRSDLYALVRPVTLAPLPVYSYGHRLVVSDQTTQRSGSYKLRGGTNAVAAALEVNPGLDIVDIASAGNAANGTFEACLFFGERRSRPIGLWAECVDGASPVKVDPLRARGAQVHAVHPDFTAAQKTARQNGKLPGHTAVEAFDAIETIAGQATIGWETLQDLMTQAARGEIDLHRDPVKLFVPVGGGGLISGVACVVQWAKEQGILGRENVQVYGVQMEDCDAMRRSVGYLRTGMLPPAGLFAPRSFNPHADGTAVLEPGQLTQLIVADTDYVADILVVSEAELGGAMASLTGSHGRPIEPAGALSLAGARQYMRAKPVSLRSGNTPETIITFTTGANVAPDLYAYFMDAESAPLRAYYDNLRGFASTSLLQVLGRKPAVVRGSRVGHSPARSA